MQIIIMHYINRMYILSYLSKRLVFPTFYFLFNQLTLRVLIAITVADDNQIISNKLS